MDFSGLSEKLTGMKRDAEERDAKRLANELGLDYLDLSTTSVNLDAFKSIPEISAREANTVPVSLKAKKLMVAVANPKAPATTALIKNLLTRYSVEVVVASPAAIEKFLANYSANIIEVKREIVSRIDLTETRIKKIGSEVGNIATAAAFMEKIAATPMPTTETMEAMLGAALSCDASDLHFEASKEAVLLRFRIDGLLHDVVRFPHSVYKQILSRIKLMSNLKINIADIPQDGRFTIKAGMEEIEIRVSIIPSEFGEAIVMRVLNPKAISLSLADLGLRPDDEEIAKLEIKRPNGMILVTGPTGSGKTTTLYAFLKAVASSESKIITVEDPIEYHLTGIEQTQVDPKSGYTFASGLRSILRQDPDMILVGEIRDAETAEIAVQASLTGHLVFSTLHTNTAVGAVPRLLDIGIKPNIIGPALTLIIAQRLVRRLCKFCRVETPISPALKAKIDKFMASLPKRVKPYTEKFQMFAPNGCDKCSNGYKGRLGIFEFLKLGGEFESMINDEVTEFSLKKFALKRGYIEMQADGILKAIAGMTTLEEVEKTTGPIEWGQ